MTESRGLNEECDETGPSRPDAIARTVRIVNKKGLHARPSAKFALIAEKFEADVRVTRCGETVGGTSIMGLLSLGAAAGTDITVEATGKDAEAVVTALADFVSSRFGEEE
jgi:phosphocarrier protein